MNTDFQQYAYIPLKQFSNRVWRTYEGGALIDKWKKDSPEVDGSMPEEWIMSTVTARGKGRPENEGLSMVQTPSGTYSLKELVASNKELYLGKALADKFGLPIHAIGVGEQIDDLAPFDPEEFAAALTGLDR